MREGGRIRSLRRAGSTGAFLLLTLLWLTGTVLRLTVRDRVPLLAAAFYALPVPVLGTVGLLSARGLWTRKRRRSAVLLAGLVLVQVGAWSTAAFRFRDGTPPETSLRLLFWNVSRGSFGYSGVAREIQRADPDVVALVEAMASGADEPYWPDLLPGYHALPLGAGLTVLVRDGSARLVERGQVRGVSRYRHVRIGCRGEQFTLLLVDVRSDPLRSRRPAFDQLRGFVERFPDEPLVVAGDFNTPVDSAWFDPLRSVLTSAFETAGRGFRETWPVILPVLSLDQVWGNARIDWHRCRHGWSRFSDHRPVIADFSIRPAVRDGTVPEP